MIVLKTERELVYMRDAGRIVGQTLQELKKAIVPGITTQELDRLADQYSRLQPFGFFIVIILISVGFLDLVIRPLQIFILGLIFF